MSKRNILVVGATGKQGQAVISALLVLPSTSSPSPQVHILAMTRNTSSPRAQALADAHPESVTVVEGDLLQPAAFFDAQPEGSIAAVFVYTTPGKQSEAAQAIPFIDAAARHGVRHIVFSSVDRGGEPKSWACPTGIKHFREKHEVELHLRDGLPAAEDGSKPPTWTILRPVAFMENMDPGMFCKLFTTMWGLALSPQTKLQLVGTRDIGRFAARALVEQPGEEREENKWAGRAVSLAGDELTRDEAREVFRKVVRQELPSTWGVLGRMLLWAVGDVGMMFAWFEREGYGADVEALRREDGELMSLEGWLRESSGWKSQIKN